MNPKMYKENSRNSWQSYKETTFERKIANKITIPIFTSYND